MYAVYLNEMYYPIEDASVEFLLRVLEYHNRHVISLYPSKFYGQSWDIDGYYYDHECDTILKNEIVKRTPVGQLLYAV